MEIPSFHFFVELRVTEVETRKQQKCGTSLNWFLLDILRRRKNLTRGISLGAHFWPKLLFWAGKNSCDVIV